jgi:hypothetical protein
MAQIGEREPNRSLHGASCSQSFWTRDAASIGGGSKLGVGTSSWGKRQGEKGGIDAPGVVNVHRSGKEDYGDERGMRSGSRIRIQASPLLVGLPLGGIQHGELARGTRGTRDIAVGRIHSHLWRAPPTLRR